MDLCAVEGCNRPKRLTGLCGAHHQRKLRKGDVQAHIPLRGTDTDPSAYWCSKCHTSKPKVEFHAEPRARRGVSGVCKACVQAHRDKIRPKLRQQSAASKTRHAGAVRERKKRWATENRDRLTEQHREWRKANPDKVRAMIKAQNARRYAIEKNAPGRATGEQITARWAYFGNKCWMCGAPATDTDHVKPLAKGGSNWPANLRPACQPCNRSKSARWPLVDDHATTRKGAARVT
jgi:5-methylcytosine-specific restriction endonuclease McrA